MTFAFCAAGASFALLVAAWFARTRRLAAAERARDEAAARRRKEARIRIVAEVGKLIELEDEAEHPRDDADPGIRDRAADLRQRLEAQCRKAGLPLGLVRLRRSDRTPPRLPELKKAGS